MDDEVQEQAGSLRDSCGRVDAGAESAAGILSNTYSSLISPRRLLLHGASHSAEIGDEDLPESPYYYSPRLLSAIASKYRNQPQPLDSHQKRMVDMASAAIPIIHRYDVNGERRTSSHEVDKPEIKKESCGSKNISEECDTFSGAGLETRSDSASENLGRSPPVMVGSPPKKPLDESHMPKLLKIHDGNIMRNVSATNLVHEVKAPSTIDAPSALPEARVLCLYTGGTIGMKSQEGVYSPQAGYLPEVIRTIPPLNDKAFIEKNFSNSPVKPYALPPVRLMKKRVVYWIVEYEPLLDSCDMTFDDWIRVATDIRKAYHNYDGFVVLHGTDTLAYTASALSFMMENLGKPVIITGSQIPVAEVRSDGMENLIGALIIAGNFDIPEVCVYFNNKLMRGNRTVKLDNSALEAFDSPNMQPLARMAIKIQVNYDSIFRSTTINPFTVHDNLCRNVGLLRIFPSMSIESVRAFLQPPTKGVILQTFGAGNMPTRRKDIIDALKEAIARGCLVVNCSQCLKGQVDVNYATGKILYDIGVIPGSDMTSEAAMAKMCYVLGKDEWDYETKRMMMQSNLRGEMTVTNEAVGMRDLDIIPHIAKCLRLSSGHELQLIRDTILPPLFCNAAKMNKPEILKNIKEAGVNFSSPDYNLRTALHVAASNGNLEAVRYLLSIGENVHVRDLFGYNPLLCAVKAKSRRCVKEIRKAGGMIDIPQFKLGVDLCLAAAHGDVEQLRCWRAAGCELTETDYDKRTPLHVAVTHYQIETVKYLMEQGLDPNVVDDFGTTPISEAKRKNFKDILGVINEVMAKRANGNGNAGVTAMEDTR